MSKRNLEFKRMTLKDFMAFFEVEDRQARRKKAEMLQKLGLPRRAHVFFPAFCQCVQHTEEEVRRFFDW